MKYLRYGLLAVLLATGLFTVLNWKSELSLEQLEAEFINEYSRWIEVEGHLTHYRIQGSGTPLILIHGTSASLHTWDDWVDLALASSLDLQIIRLDMPGFGLTGAMDDFDYTLPQYAGFLKSFLDQMGLDSVLLAGNSLGAEISWEFASSWPQQVKALNLINSAGYPPQDNITLAFKMARTPGANVLMTRVTPTNLIRKSLEEVYFDDELVSKELVQRYLSLQRRAGNRAAFVKRMNAPDDDRTDRLGQITAPTLITWGEADEWIPVGDCDRYAAAIPDAVCQRLSAGHVPHEESPEASWELFENFLQQRFPDM